jgi:hypothetical protein
MTTNQPLSPDELFRQYQRGMLDQNTLFSQILQNLIDVKETQQAHGLLLELMSEELSGLGLDVETIANLLRLVRPSQTGAADGTDAAGPAGTGDA